MGISLYRNRDFSLLGAEPDKGISVGLLPTGSKVAIPVSEGWNNL